jgi:hypothetical protein
MQIFIDESGDLGRRGRFFVIAALLPNNSKRIKNVIRRCCVEFGTKAPLEEIKGSLLKLPQRQRLINSLLSKDDFRIAYIVADKKFLQPQLTKRKSICFNYLTQHLLKPLIKEAEEDIKLILDNRNIKVASGNTLRDYLEIEAITKWGFKHKIHLNYMDSRDSKNLQAVDVVANTVFQKYERNLHHAYGLFKPQVRYGKRFPYQKFGC